MQSVYLSTQDRIEYSDVVASVLTRRNRIAKQLRNFRNTFRAAGLDTKSHDLYKWLDSRDQRFLKTCPKPGSLREYVEAWETVQYYENFGVDLGGLPCGSDDLAYDRAVARKAAAMAVVREYGRPLP